MIPENLRFTRFWTPPDNNSSEHSRTIKRAKKILGIIPDFYKDKIVLDCGCGWGNASKWIIGIGSGGGNAKQVIGIDVNPIVLEKLKTSVPIDNLCFVGGNIYETNFENDLFDIIVCTEVIEHLDTDELELLLEEWKRILKLNGLVWISTPNKRFDRKNFPEGNGSHWIEYEQKELADLFITHEFKVVVSLKDENLWFLIEKL